MLSNGKISTLVKFFGRIALTLALFGITQCTFLPEQIAKIEADLSDGDQALFNITLVADASADRDGHLDRFMRVIADDLTRSGRFKVHIKSAKLDNTKAEPGDAPQQSEFESIGHISRQDDRFLIDFSLYLANQDQKLNSYQRFAKPSEFRHIAHRVSDNLFQTILGVRGPFSTKLCFVTAHGKLNERVYGLWVADADGHNRIPLYSSNEPIMSPSWSPNGKQIAFIAFKKNDRQGLFIYDLEGKSIRELKLSEKGLVGAPSWSPNSEYLAFTFIRNGNADIYALDLHGDEEIRLTHANAIDTEAVWMPDSQSIIFTSDRAGTPQLYQINLDGSNLTRVTYNGRENAQASVSPLGKNIAMIHKRNGRYHIALLNRSSKKLKVLTHGNEDESPSFSPGGSMILYSSVSAERSALNIISSNGRIQKVLAKFDDVRQPTWSPLL